MQRALAETFAKRRRKPAVLRSDNGREFIAGHLTRWQDTQQIERAYIEKGRPNQNGIVERLNGLMRRHVLDVEDFHTLLEARVVIHDWVEQYNQLRPHGALGDTPPSQYHKQYMTKLQTEITTSRH